MYILDNRYGCLWIALKYFCEEQKSAAKDALAKSTSLSNSVSSFKSPSSPLNQSATMNTTNSSSVNRQQSLNASFDLTVKLNTSYSNLFSDSVLKECNELIENFNSPYLKALFNFLINKEEALMKILVGYRIYD
jgi:hypothetical protein